MNPKWENASTNFLVHDKSIEFLEIEVFDKDHLDSIVDFKSRHPELIMGNDEILREEFPLNIEGPDMPLDVDTTEEEQK